MENQRSNQRKRFENRNNEFVLNIARNLLKTRTSRKENVVKPILGPNVGRGYVFSNSPEYVRNYIAQNRMDINDVEIKDSEGKRFSNSNDKILQNVPLNLVTTRTGRPDKVAMQKVVPNVRKAATISNWPTNIRNLITPNYSMGIADVKIKDTKITPSSKEPSPLRAQRKFLEWADCVPSEEKGNNEHEMEELLKQEYLRCKSKSQLRTILNLTDDIDI